MFGASLKLILPFIIIFPGIIAYELYAEEITNPNAAFLQLYWGFIQPGIVAAFFFGMVWDKIPPAAALIGMALNIPVYGALLYFLPDIAFFHQMMITFIVIVAVMSVYTRLYPWSIQSPFRFGCKWSIGCLIP